MGLLAESVDDKGDCWPQIPIGQIVWALMSDKSDAECDRFSSIFHDRLLPNRECSCGYFSVV